VLITRRAAYGLIAAKHVAEHEDAGAITSSEIAAAHGLPRETVAKVLQRLADAGLLLAHHGARGGYTLALEPCQISALAVIRASGSPDYRSRDPRGGDPGIAMLRHTIEGVLDCMRIADLAECNRTADPECKTKASRFSARVPCQW
jgi:Rrf2 family protein